MASFSPGESGATALTTESNQPMARGGAPVRDDRMNAMQQTQRENWKRTELVFSDGLVLARSQSRIGGWRDGGGRHDRKNIARFTHMIDVRDTVADQDRLA